MQDGDGAADQRAEAGGVDGAVEAIGDLAAHAGDQRQVQLAGAQHRREAGQEAIGELGLRAGATDGEGDARRAVGGGERPDGALDLVAEVAAEDAVAVEAGEAAQEVRLGDRQRRPAEELVRQRKAGERDALLGHAVGDEAAHHARRRREVLDARRARMHRRPHAVDVAVGDDAADRRRLRRSPARSAISAGTKNVVSSGVLVERR